MELFLILVIIFIAIVIYYNNKMIQVENKVKEALSDIDVALSRRYNTIINLVEVVKGYAKHELEVFSQIAKMRSHMTMEERNDIDFNHQQASHQLFALKEAYPELKASEQFLNLQRAIIDLEEHIAASRRMYNANVSVYNNLIQMFPSNMIAKMNHKTEIEYFKATNQEKENINIKGETL